MDSNLQSMNSEIIMASPSSSSQEGPGIVVAADAVVASSSSNDSANSNNQNNNQNQNNKRAVKFDERCRVRPIRKLQYLDPQVRAKMWYNREELKGMRKDCRNLMKEALNQLQKAQAKQKKKEAQEKFQEKAQESHPCSPRSQASSDRKKNKKKKNHLAKHLFPPSAFRGLEMFHPKMSFKREGRRQEQWEAILTEQAQQEMARRQEDASSSDVDSRDDDSEEQEETKKQQLLLLRKEEDLLQLAKLSLTMTQIASKEAHRRALRDQQDLLHPPKYWMLPWLVEQEEEGNKDGSPTKKASPRRSVKKKGGTVIAIPTTIQVELEATESPKTPKTPRSSPRHIKKGTVSATTTTALLSKLELEAAPDASSSSPSKNTATTLVVESPRRIKLRELLQVNNKQDSSRTLTPPTPPLNVSDLKQQLRTVT